MERAAMIIRFEHSWESGGWNIFAFERLPTGGRVPFKITIEALSAVRGAALRYTTGDKR